MRQLIGTGLQYPQGLAMDSYRNYLYVADPGLQKLVRYPITTGRGDALYAGAQEVVAQFVEVRAVSVDGFGNVYFTEEPTQNIWRVTWDSMVAGTMVPESVYNASTLSSVSAPGGIAVDNFFIYWVNKASGTSAGTLVRGHHKPPSAGMNITATTNVLASNSAKCYGVCIARGNIFYTDDQSSLYGIQRSATARHDPVVVTTGLQEPRGCAYDGTGTVYVADKAQNAVFQFPGNMLQPFSFAPQKAIDLQGAFGVAIHTVALGWKSV